VDGNTYEGIFRIFSPQLELTLDVAHLVDAKDPGKICEENVRSMVFNMRDVIRCSAIDTDLDYATKGTQSTSLIVVCLLGNIRMFELNTL